MRSKTTWIFYEKWRFWTVLILLIIRAYSILNRQSPKNEVKLDQELKIEDIKILGVNAHFFIKDIDEKYTRLYVEWPQNITLSSDSTFIFTSFKIVIIIKWIMALIIFFNYSILNTRISTF